MLNKSSLLTKAILFEIKEGFDSKTLKYDEKARIPILQEVITFYNRFNECFKYTIKYPINSDTSSFQPTDPSLDDIEKWAEENNILYISEHKFDNMSGCLEFMFTNEQDVMAFKLKWL